MPIREVGTFSIKHLGILDEQGRLDADLEPALPDDTLVGMYRTMWLAREVDQKALKLQRQGRLGTFGPSTGQEAASTAPAFAMTDKDWFVGSFRELGGWLARGMAIENFLLFNNGWEEGSVFPQLGRTLPVSIIVGAQTLHAVGLAFAMRYKGEDDAAVVAFFGDGATSEGDFHEALNFAGVWKAPVVFICQNNQWAISVPRSKQTRSETLAQKAIAYGIEGIQVDGNDALAMYQATKDALDRAKRGDGPTLIEAVTYRLIMHTTADDPSKYRSEDDVAPWWEKEPLRRFRTYLETKGIWDQTKQAAMEQAVAEEIAQAVKAFELRTEFKPDAPFDHVFGTSHPEIERQRAEFLARLKQDEGHHG